MKNILLKIKPKEQAKHECAVACLEMIFDSFEIPYLRKELIKECSLGSKKAGDWYFRLGQAALKRGLKVEIITRSLRIFDPTWFNFTSEELIKRLKKSLSKKDNLEEKKQAISFLKQGGKIAFEAISAHLLQNSLKKEKLAIVPVYPSLIIPKIKRRNKKGQPDDIRGEAFGHVVLINGWKNDKFIVTDPGGKTMNLGTGFSYNVNPNEIIEANLRSDMHVVLIGR